MLFLEEAAIIKCFPQETYMLSIIMNYLDLKARQVLQDRSEEWMEGEVKTLKKSLQSFVRERACYNSALFTWEAGWQAFPACLKKGLFSLAAYG